MQASFARLLERLQPKFEELMRMRPGRFGSLPRLMPQQGVYLFSENERHLFVGRSNTIRSRYGRHCNPRSTHRMATFAFHLACEATGKTGTAGEAGENSKKGLMLNRDFRAAFDSAKARIRQMEFRSVGESDQNVQALLAIYCTLALNAKYNDFNTQ